MLCERVLPGHDPERMIEHWAREQGAGVYAQNHRTGGSEHLEEVMETMGTLSERPEGSYG